MSNLLTAKELKERIEKNDNRATATPYLLLLRERRKVSCDPDYNCDGVEFVEQLSGDYLSFESLEKTINWLSENDEEYEYKESDVVKWHYQEIDETKNVFLTDEGHQEHLRINGHNLRNQNTYGIHAFRNREIKSLYALIDANIELEARVEELEKTISDFKTLEIQEGFDVESCIRYQKENEELKAQLKKERENSSAYKSLSQDLRTIVKDDYRARKMVAKNLDKLNGLEDDNK